jgi:hypothetical protein
VSQSIIMSQLGRVPSRPMAPVTYGRSSGSTAFPSSALATPAPSSSATSATSSDALSAPAPTSMATFFPSFSTRAARCRSLSVGITCGSEYPIPVNAAPCTRGACSMASISCTSFGRMMQVTVRSAIAIRSARSTRCRIWAGVDAMWTYWLATSLNSEMRSTSCWKSAPSPMVACCPTIATTGWWSIFAS